MIVSLTPSLGALTGGALGAQEAYADSRTEITQIIATSNITTPAYGEPIPDPVISVQTGSPAWFQEPTWYKKTTDDWEVVEGGTFSSGTYQCAAIIRISDGGTEYVLGWPVTVTVDGVEWTSGWDGPEVADTWSRLGIGSPEYVVTAPPDAPLTFTDKSSYDIGTTYIGEAFSDFSVASSAEGGKTPYVFSKTAGPAWISVSSDGIVSGTPTSAGSNDDLVVRVTDANGDYAEISIDVASTVIDPADRAEITQIIATSNIKIPVYGEPIPEPAISVQTGSPAWFQEPTWYKKTTDDWEVVSGGTFSEGIYRCSAIIRISNGGTEYVLGWPISVSVDGVEWTSGWDGPEVNDTWSRLGIGSPDYVVEKCPAGGGHDWQIVYHKASFTVDGYQSMECSKCGKPHDDGIAIGALKVKTAKLEKTSYAYTGKAIKPAVTLASADGPLSKDYYTVSYTDSKGNAVSAPTNAGPYKVKITLKGDYYEGTKTLPFEITPVKLSSATLKTTAFTWSGNEKKPTATVKAKVNGTTKTLKAGTDYTITYKNNKNVGKATATIKGKGNYTGTITKTFKINPKKAVIKAPAAASKAVTVKWTKQATKMSASRITGYQIQVATDSKFTKNKKSVTVKGYSKVSKKVTGLKGGKKYYVRVRIYKTVSGVKYYSPWSAVKSVTTKK